MTQNPITEMVPSLKDAAQAAGSVAADIKAAAAQKLDETLTEVKSQAADARANVAGEVNDVAMALRRASEDLRDGSAQERTLGYLATTLADVSDAVRDKDLGEMLHSAGKIARNNPVLFLGGAALLGFAASRFAKATSGPNSTFAMHKATEDRDQVKAFVDEGNPNIQPVKATP